jgi:hypothetical protein
MAQKSTLILILVDTHERKKEVLARGVSARGRILYRANTVADVGR